VSGSPRDAFSLLWSGLPGDLQSLVVTVGKGEDSPSQMRRTKAESREVKSGVFEANALQVARARGKP
jgi:hypothetical protein